MRTFDEPRNRFPIALALLLIIGLGGQSAYAHPSENPLVITDEMLAECPDDLPRTNLSSNVSTPSCPDRGFESISDKTAGGVLRYPGRVPFSFNIIDSFFSPVSSAIYQLSSKFAERIEYSDDLSSSTIYIRPGIEVAYADGRSLPFNAHTLKFVADTFFQADPNNPSELFFFQKREVSTNSINGQTDGYPDISVRDELVLHIEYPAPFPVIRLLDEFIIPYSCGPIHPDAVGLSQDFPNLSLQELRDLAITRKDPEIFTNALGLNTDIKNIPSCGPFILTEFDPDSYARLIKNEHYFMVDQSGRGLPLLDELEIVFTSNPAQLFEVGALDFITPQPEEMPSIQALVGVLPIRINVGEEPLELSTKSFLLNQDLALGKEAEFSGNNPALRVVFRNPVFRRAMSKLIDRQRMRDEALSGYGIPWPFTISVLRATIALGDCPIARLEPATQIFCDRYSNEIDTLNGGLLYDRAIAEEMLDSIGLFDRDGDGIRDIPKFFGQILPGRDQILDTVPDPNTDDEYHDIAENIIILPGPNGILDTVNVGDDVVVQTEFKGELQFPILTNEGNSVREIETEIFAQELRAVGIDATPQFIPFPRLAGLVNDKGSADWKVMMIGFSTGLGILGSFGVHASCFSLGKPSGCEAFFGVIEDDREPFQQRIDNIAAFGIMNDPFTGRDIPNAFALETDADLARVAGEIQFLASQNLPNGPYTTARASISAQREDRVGNLDRLPQNNDPWNLAIMYSAELN